MTDIKKEKPIKEEIKLDKPIEDKEKFIYDIQRQIVFPQRSITNNDPYENLKTKDQ